MVRDGNSCALSPALDTMQMIAKNIAGTTDLFFIQLLPIARRLHLYHRALDARRAVSTMHQVKRNQGSTSCTNVCNCI